MIDWTTLFPYALIASLALLAIGIYALITCKNFLRAVFGIEILLMAANLLLLSFGLGSDETTLISDPFAQTLSLMIIAVSVVFLILGSSINRLLQESNDEILEFNFKVDDITIEKNDESKEQTESPGPIKEEEEE